MIDINTFLELGIRAQAVLIRVSFIIFFMPLIGDAYTPVRIRLLFALALTGVLLPVVQIDPALLPQTPMQVLFALFPEFLLGLTLGLTARLVFAAVQFAGQLAGEQIGFGIANVIDPTQSAEISIVAQTWFLFSLLFFLAIDGHHIFISAILRSFELVPLFAAQMPADLLHLMNRSVAEMFAIGILCAAPVLAAMLITNMAMGLVAKAVPQVNIFIESFPIRIALGLLIMGVTFTALGSLLAKQFTRMDHNLEAVLQLMR